MNPMGWWRRNWVDTLMITLILLVVGGFISLLLRGTPGLTATNNTPATTAGQNVTTSSPASAPTADSTSSPNATSGKPVTAPTTKPSSTSGQKPSGSSTTEGNKATPTEMTRVEPSSVTASASSKPATGASSTDESAMGKESQALSANSSNAQSKADSPQLDSSEPAQATGAQAPSSATVTLSKAAPKPAPPVVSTIVETPVTPKPVIQAPPARPTPITSASKSAAKPQVVNKAVTSSPSRSVYLRSFRIAVGSFSAPSRAESLASSLRGGGLPARAIRSGGKTVVIVGPYKTEGEAQAAFDQVKTAHSDAILFKPNGIKVRANAGTQAGDVPSKTAPAQAVPEATSSTPALASDDLTVVSSPEGPQTAPEPTQAKPAPLGRYLQVGAFKDIVSAGPVLTKLAKYGYRGTLDQGSDGLTRVLVGPYDTNTFERAKRNLRSRGFKVFAAK